MVWDHEAEISKFSTQNIKYNIKVKMFKIFGYTALMVIIPPSITNIIRGSTIGTVLSLIVICASLLLIRISK